MPPVQTAARRWAVRRFAIAIPFAFLLPMPVHAAALDGASLGPGWALPFLGILTSIAVLPQVAPGFWHRHMGKLSGVWAAATILPLGLAFGWGAALDSVLHVILAEYLPFIILLLALYTIAGGIVISGNLHGSPLTNTAILALGTGLASVIGTTGAAMVLVRPLIRANDDRRHNAHVFVFFIFLVANIGGALTPLGDPPLFLGFLRGVDFFWTARALLLETMFAVLVLLVLFYVIDRVIYTREGVLSPDPTPDRRLHVTGRVNVLLIGVLVAMIVASGAWRSDLGLDVGGTHLALQNLLRDGVLLGLAALSLVLTPRGNRSQNEFSWDPIVEVAKIFAAIFVCIVPVGAALAAGDRGIFGPLLHLVSRADGSPDAVAYFWLTGLLSSVLDNAPTYLVFFDLAGGDPARLMGPLAGTLAAISSGAVFMGALTYLGNAPNFMVYAIARGRGVEMPGFLGYMAWSGAILLPLFGLVTLVFIG